VEPERSLPEEVAAALHHLDELVQMFEQHADAEVRERVFELLQCVDAVHRAGLTRLHALVALAGLEQRALADPEAALLLELYELGRGAGTLDLPDGSALPAAPPPGFVPLSSITVSRRPG
jgi:hypothetical protein